MNIENDLRKSEINQTKQGCGYIFETEERHDPLERIWTIMLMELIIFKF